MTVLLRIEVRDEKPFLNMEGAEVHPGAWPWSAHSSCDVSQGVSYITPV